MITEVIHENGFGYEKKTQSHQNIEDKKSHCQFEFFYSS